MRTCLLVGTAVGGAVGLAGGYVLSFYAAWAIMDYAPGIDGSATWFACWLICVLIGAGLGGYFAYDICRDDDP